MGLKDNLKTESETVVAEYDFDEDAMGLGDFIQGTIASLPDSEIHVYVTDEQGRNATKAVFVREKLTDGSTTVNLFVHFDRQYDKVFGN